MQAKWLSAELERIWLLAEARLGGLDRSPELDKALANRPKREDLATRTAKATEEALELRAQVPLGRLAAKLDLGKLEVETLLIALAPHLDERLDCVFRHLQNDYNRRGVDLALVAELLGLDRAERIPLLETLDLDRPLIALRLLSAESGPGRSALYRQIAPNLDSLGVLSGRRALSPKLALVADLLTGEPDEMFFATEQLETLSPLARSAADNMIRGAHVIVWGASGVGKRELAHRIAANAGLPLLALDPTHVSGDGDEQLRRAKREALLSEAVLYVGPCSGELIENGASSLFARFAGYRGPLVLGFETTLPPKLDTTAPVVEIEIEPPSRAARSELWRRAVPNVDTERVARAYRLTPGEIAAIGRELETTDESQLASAIDRRLRTELSGLATRLDAHARWDELVLPDEQLERVRQLIDRHRHADTVYEQWNMGERVRRGRGVIALLSGPPGTGKTMLAQIIASELGLELYKVDLSQVVSKWVGETEKQLARIFELAERAHAVLLFDEADALLSKRTKVESANDRYGNLAVNYLLQRFEDYAGVVILTTNAASALDDAMARRLTAHLRLEEPDEDERLLLWQSMLTETLPLAAELDLSRIAEDFELSGGHIKNAALRAAFFAAREKSDIDTDMLRRAAVLEMQDMGRIA